MKMNLDLGHSFDCPSCAIEQSSPETKKMYPSMRIEMDGEGPDLPDEGTMTIRFKKVEETSYNRGEKTRYSCVVEAKEILDVTAEDSAPAKTGSKATEDALDELAKKYSKE